MDQSLEELRCKYLAKINDLKKKTNLKYLDDESLNSIIERLKRKEITSKKFDFIPNDILLGGDILILKRSYMNDPIVRVLSAESCFTIIIDAHIKTQHGYHQELKKFTSQYWYPVISIDIMLDLCSKCQKHVQECIFSNIITKNAWQLAIVRTNLSTVFSNVLIYFERNTRFTLIRPLLKKYTDEISSELIKIFTLFGTPDVLIVSNSIVYLIKAALFRVYQMAPEIRETYNLNTICYTTHQIDYVHKSLENMIKTKNMSLEMACHVVQIHFNTKKSETYGNGVLASPYERLFPTNNYQTKVLAELVQCSSSDINNFDATVALELNSNKISVIVSDSDDSESAFYE